MRNPGSWRVSKAQLTEMETLWARSTGSDPSLSKDQFVRMHQHLYSRLLGLSDPALSTIVNSAIEEDWKLDAADSASLDFGAYFVSFLEVADNWIPVRDPEAYATFVSQAFADFGSEACAAAGTSQRTLCQDDWERVVDSIKDFAQSLSGVPVIRARRLPNGNIMYEKTALQPDV